MEEKNFINEMVELLEIEDEFSMDSLLEDICCYDSMAILMLIEWFDSNGVDVSPDEFSDIKTLNDLYLKLEK